MYSVAITKHNQIVFTTDSSLRIMDIFAVGLYQRWVQHSYTFPAHLGICIMHREEEGNQADSLAAMVLDEIIVPSS